MGVPSKLATIKSKDRCARKRIPLRAAHHADDVIPDRADEASDHRILKAIAINNQCKGRGAV